MANWKRKKQENEGKYFFNGFFYCTQKVQEELTQEEIIILYLDVKNFAERNNGIDYLQVYEDGNNHTLFFIDNLDEDAIASGEFAPEDNYCTLLFSDEY